MAVHPRPSRRAASATRPFPVLLVVALVLTTTQVKTAGQFGRRIPTIPEPESSSFTFVDLDAQFLKQLEAGELDAAEDTLEEMEQAQPLRTGCLQFDQIDSLTKSGMQKDAKKLQDQMKKRKQLDSQKAAECEQARKRRADLKLQLATSRRTSRASPLMLYSRPPMFIEPAPVMGMESSLMMAQLAGYQRLFADAAPGGLQATMMRAAASAESNDLTAAEEQFQKIATIARQMLGDTDPAVGMFLLNLSALEQRRSRFDEALAYARSAQEVMAKASGANSPQQCPALWQQASILSETANTTGAAEAAETCIRLATPLGATSVTLASAVNNLGVVYHRAGDLKQATDAYQRSLQLLAQPGTSSPDGPMAQQQIPQVRSNLGLARWRAGDPVGAYEEFRRAQELMKREGEIFQSEEQALAALGKLSVEQEAYVTLEIAAGGSAQAERPIGLQMLLERKGLALERKSEQMASARRALEPGQTDQRGSAAFTAASQRGLMEQYQKALADRAALQQSRPSSPEEAAALKREVEWFDTRIQVIEQELATASTQASNRNMVDTQSSEYQAMTKEQQKRSIELLKAAAEKAKKNKDKSREAIFAAASELTMALNSGPATAAYMAAQQRREQEARRSLLERIQSKLPPNGALLEMVRFRPFNPGAASEAERWGAARYGTYLVRKAGQPTFLDYGESAPIDEQIVEFRRALSQPRGTLAHDLGRRLDSLLMQPLRAQLGDAEQLLVSPEGLLNLIPFGALVDEQNRYLVERFAFNYLSSGRDLLREPPPAAGARGPAVIVAAPAFGEPANSQPVSNTVAAVPMSRSRSFDNVRFEPLPGTSEEARSLAQIVTGAVLLTGDQATETAVKRVSRPRILHIATHGFFLQDNDTTIDGAPAAENPMLRSGLALAGANRLDSGLDDGLLTALEAAALDLTGTRVVILSACETGVGEIRNGEGVFGLRRAFMTAGAETLIMSLWQVEDDATRQLMVEYHRRLARGEGRAEALRQAEIALMRDPAHSHPFFWASFISSGESSGMN